MDIEEQQAMLVTGDIVKLCKTSRYYIAGGAVSHPKDAYGIIIQKQRGCCRGISNYEVTWDNGETQWYSTGDLVLSGDKLWT